MKAALVREEFQRWLEQHSADEVIGKGNHARDCPVAKYLEADCVGLTYAFPLEETESAQRIIMPRWARLFIQEIDHEFSNQEPVTASQALAVLMQIPLTSP